MGDAVIRRFLRTWVFGTLSGFTAGYFALAAGAGELVGGVAMLLRGWALMVLLGHLHVIGLGDVSSSYLGCVGFAWLLGVIWPTSTSATSAVPAARR